MTEVLAIQQQALVGRYRPYPEYKDSGGEWLGLVPIHWAIAPLKRLAKIVNGSTPKSEIVDYWDGDITWVTPADLGKGSDLSITTSKRSITNAGLLSCGTSLVPKGSVVISTRAPIGSLGIAGKALCTNQGCKSLVMTATMISDFMFYFLLVSGKQLNTQGKGTTFLELSSEDLANFDAPYPPLTEQCSIAAFLDYETARIDRLIAQQQRLIELLKEKRQAVISHAVTKGLNPDAPMKDSGVEWLGQVPEHWALSKLSYLVTTRKGVAFKADYFCDDGIPVVKASDIKELTIRASSTCLPSKFVSAYPKAVLNEMDIILSTVGSTPDVKNSAVGQLGMVPDSLDGALLNQNTVVFDLRVESCSNNYLFLLLQTKGYRDHLDLHAHGTANQASLNVSDMLDFTVVLPPLTEGLQLVASVKAELSRLERLEKNCNLLQVTLQERRTALISAAVTGKIDLRGWTLPAEEVVA